MRIIADLHVHSKYARATSSRCDIVGLSEGAKIKGIDVVATGDFTHPLYFKELKAYLKEEKDGLYSYNGVNFILSTELAITYGEVGSKKRMHHVVLAPSLEIVEQINDRMGKYGKLMEDGRPMLSISSAELVEQLEEISKGNIIIPAHAWTPWFGIFGSKTGVDSIEEAFEDKADRIFAIETGLSSDPAMNWMISALDKYTLVSNSDCHSPEKLGREGNVFELDKAGYREIIDAIRTRKGFVKTYEFYPEEGKYHYDGHRECRIRWSPWESIKHNDVCPVCRKKVTVGVLHRVVELADRKPGFKPENTIPFQHIVPLNIVISKVLGKNENTVGVKDAYSKLIEYFGNEFSVFEAHEDQIRLGTTPEIAEAIIKVKTENVAWLPGYDGVFGELVLEKKKEALETKQRSLNEF